MVFDNPNFSNDLIRAVIALFVIIDPIGLIPIVISLTSDMKKEERKHTINTAIYVSTILLVAFALVDNNYCRSLVYL